MIPESPAAASPAAAPPAMQWHFDADGKDAADPELKRECMAFQSYAALFADPDGSYGFPVRMKFLHTQDVLRIATWILAHENRGIFSAEERRCALLAALFHDVSRFEQYRRFGTFRDAASFDHGARSAEIMLESFAGDFTEKEKRVVADAVRVHNKPVIPPDFPAESLKTARITRDADKLSIFSLILKFFNDKTGQWSDRSMRLDLPDNPGFSASIVQDVLAGKSVLHTDLRNVNDFKISLFSWSHDLNFPASAVYVLENNFYSELVALLPESAPGEELFRFAVMRLESLKRGENKGKG